MDRLREYSDRQREIEKQAKIRANQSARISCNKLLLNISPEQYRINFANSQMYMDVNCYGDGRWRKCPDLVYRKLMEAICYVNLHFDYTRNQKRENIRRKFDKLRIELRIRRISEQVYNHILETPIPELVKELSDKVIGEREVAEGLGE